MTTYISLLRGINVSGQRQLKMDALRRCYENLGFSGITTYVQSGNVIFSSQDYKEPELAEIISHQIAKDFGFEVQVIVLTSTGLKEIINDNPFPADPSKDPSFLHVTFLASRPDGTGYRMIGEKKQGGEEIAFSGKVVYLYCPHGYGKTRLNNGFLETKLKVWATTRNWKTTNELYRIAVTGV
jgi:uncharacterized protein (DUF1697 family)